MIKLSKEEEAKKIEQVKKIFEDEWDGYYPIDSETSVVMIDSENAFICTSEIACFCNIPTEDVFELGKIETGEELGYEEDYGLKHGGYYFVPTYDEYAEPDANPSESIADEIDFLNGCYGYVDYDYDDDDHTYSDEGYDLFQKEVAELKKEQKQNQENE